MRLRQLFKLIEDYNSEGTFTDEKGVVHPTLTSMYYGGDANMQMPTPAERRKADLAIAKRRKAEKDYHNPYVKHELELRGSPTKAIKKQTDNHHVQATH
jgi:hypothetical protein